MELDPAIREVFTQAGEAMVQYGLSVFGALAILIVGWWIAGRLQEALGRLLNRVPRMDATLKSFLRALVRYVVMALTLVAVLAQFGVQTASIIAMLGAAGLAIGLALQGTLQNVAAGVMLLLLRPFNVDDFIDAEGISGTVRSIGLFTSELCTFDGVFVSVPNAQLWGRSIRNFSRNPTRRVDVVVGISYGDDIDRAMEVLRRLFEDPRVLRDPAPDVMVNALADSSVNINIRCWVAAGDYWAIFFHLHKAAKQALDGAGITIPFPQRDVHLHQVKG